ncbi:MAG TPA: cytochrome c oxidase subunit II [Isosphaeraceae bacterium]|jgi:cytochrome c oxidase subunit 2|nr:cytochrome c oxidase subunit II [Isosphaeraceae bacterium]
MVTENLSIFQPASPTTESIRNLSILLFAITGFIFILVEGVLFYCVVRFRKRATPSAEPPQVYGSKPIEIAWTAAPGLIVLIILLVTTRTLWEVNTKPPRPRAADQTLFVTVIGRQWWWEYRYDHYNGKKLGFITANELHIPVSDGDVSRPVYLTLKSADVCHSFWVPRLSGKTDLIPGRVNSMWFQTERKGLFVGQCAEYCGTQHANMLLRVVVDSPQDFERWLENQGKPAAEPSPALAAGKEAFLAQSCVNCHRVRGTLAQGSYAPDLTHLMSRQTLAAGMIPNTAENLRMWIEAPQKIKPGCLMPGFGLADRDRELIVGYLQNLR